MIVAVQNGERLALATFFFSYLHSLTLALEGFHSLHSTLAE